MEVESPNDSNSQWHHLKKFLSTNGPLQNSEYEANPQNFSFMQEHLRVLVIGAGGLGCELLKDLALMGFKNIGVIDMDTIDLSNLNRQFLFRAKDIGKPKATVAAEFINRRMPNCNVVPHYCKIQDFDQDFYRGFNVVVCGLDSIVARRWMNGMLLSLLVYDSEGQVDATSIIPLIDGGTEGFKGNARVIYPGMTACIECNLDLFPKQINFPLCTLAETPRLPEHCIEYIKLIKWPEEKPFGVDVSIDGDNPEHISWIFNQAAKRASVYGIQGLTYRLTQGVVKHIIPAVASTNAVIAAMCVAEVFKVITMCYPAMNNYTVFNDAQGVYTYTFEAERKKNCPACSNKPVDVKVDFGASLETFLTSLKDDEMFQMKSPGVTAMLDGKSKTLYIPNIPSLEATTKVNLQKTLAELDLSPGHLLNITDPSTPKVVSLCLKECS